MKLCIRKQTISAETFFFCLFYCFCRCSHEQQQKCAAAPHQAHLDFTNARRLHRTLTAPLPSAAPEDEDAARVVAAATALLRAWLSDDHAAARPGEPTAGASHSAASQAGGSTLPLPPPPQPSVLPVPPLQLPPRNAGPPAPERHVDPAVPRLRISPMRPCAAAYVQPEAAAPLSGRRQGSARSRLPATTPNSTANTSSPRPAVPLSTAPSTAAPAAAPRSHGGAGEASANAAGPHARPQSGPAAAPRVQRRLMFSSAFHDPAARRAALRDAGAPGCSGVGASASSSGAAALSGGLRGSSAMMAPAARRAHPVGARTEQKVAEVVSAASQRHIWTHGAA